MALEHQKGLSGRRRQEFESHLGHRAGEGSQGMGLGTFTWTSVGAGTTSVLSTSASRSFWMPNSAPATTAAINSSLNIPPR